MRKLKGRAGERKSACATKGGNNPCFKIGPLYGENMDIGFIIGVAIMGGAVVVGLIIARKNKW